MTIDVGLDDRPHFALALKPVAEAVCVAREIVRAALEAWGMTELIGDTELVTSELITNAVQHADEITLLLYESEGGQVVTEVWDDCPHGPAVRGEDPYSEGGRGLMLVRGFALSWGWRPVEGGKVVWAIVGPEPSK